MSGRLWRILLPLASLGIALFSFVSGYLAQNSFIVTLTPPDTNTYPHLTTYLDVHDSAGGFVHGLTAQAVTLQENGSSVPVTGLVEKKPGVQFVLAITPGSSFTIRDASGISRYDDLLQGLLAGTWAGQPAGADDFCLLIPGGPQISHSPSPAALRSSLEAYTPDDSTATPNLEVLASALQVASDPTPRPGMERAILFITPPQDSGVSLGLQSISASANQQNIHVFVWLVAPQESFSLPEIDLLRNLADQTHAAFFAFSHDESVPDLETLLEPLRYVYQVGYDTQAAVAGTQQVVAQVTIGSDQVTSQPQSFELNLQSPSLVILNPPTEIVRRFPTEVTPGSTNAVGDLQPAETRLSIQVSFPDGYPRPLARSSLYIDGSVVAENTSPPFDQFVWDLRSYTQDATYILRIDAADSLGWVGQTNEISVKVIVPSTTQEVVAVVAQKRLLVIGLTVFISASILVLVLILGGRIHPKPFPGQVWITARIADKALPAKYQDRKRMLRDPVTQPVKIGLNVPAKAKTASTGWRERLPWFKHKEAPITAMAYLVPLVGSDEPTLPAPLQITADLVSLGSDPQKADLVISDPSIEGLHARIQHEEKSFHITDAGSVAGTWLNYEQLTSEGSNLEHADIIHLGRVGFRFNTSAPGVQRRVTVTPLERDQ